MSVTKGLSNKKQALLMLIPFITGLSAWIGLGAPTDKASLLILLNNELGFGILAIKEYVGSSE